MPLKTERFYEFGRFRLDAEQRLLFRDGERVEMAPKVLDTLILLVENHKDLVTKDELIQKLWPDTFVEEGNLTFNISTLRKTLGDDRNNGNRFIETVPKRGYRFIAPVRTEGAGAQPHRGSEPETQPRHGTSSVPPASRSLWHLGATIALISAGILAYWVSRPSPSPIVAGYHPLTHDLAEKGSTGPIVTDGLKVYFIETSEGIPRLASVSTAGGEIAPLVMPQWESFGIEDIAPDHRELLLGFNGALWTLPVPAGAPRKWAGLPPLEDAGWFPDGKTLVFGKGRELFGAKADGSAPTRIADAPGAIDWPRVSPDGKSLRFTVVYPGTERQALWEVRIDGAHLRPLFPNWSANLCCGNWTPDGRSYFFIVSERLSGVPDSQIWAVTKSGKFGRSGDRRPIQLSHSSQIFSSPVSSPDGKQIFAIGEERQGELMRYDSRLQEFVPFLPGISGTWLNFSSDGKKVVYDKYPGGTLWVANQDGSGARQLAFAPTVVDGATLSPDGEQVAYRAQEPGKPFKICLIRTDGSESQGHEMHVNDDREEGIPTWSPDGTKIAFGDVPQKFASDDGTHVIRVFDLQMHTLSSLPGSNGLWTARWSPDGRYIAAVTISDPQRLEIFDEHGSAWRDLAVRSVNNPTWSHDSSYIYFDSNEEGGHKGIFRVRVADGKVERVAGLEGLRRAVGSWSGLTPNDEPLILRDLGTSEIYALDVDWP